MPGWDNFFVAQAGASAALAGLVFVGISINLAKIVKMAGVLERAIESLIILALVLVTSALMLVPRQSLPVVSFELIGVGLVVWIMLARRQFTYWRKVDAKYLHYMPVRVGLVQAALLPFILAGVFMLALGPDGFYWIVPGVVFSYIVALLNAWILMIEINRV